MTNRFIVNNALTQCNTLFGKNIGKENDEIMSDLLFISIPKSVITASVKP